MSDGSTAPNAVYEFRSEGKVAALAGGLLAVMELSPLAMAVAYSDQGAPAPLGVAGAVLLILAAAAFTYMSRIRIDTRSGRRRRKRAASGRPPGPAVGREASRRLLPDEVLI